jgi:glycine/D-amino acid oxidase-like deaminating enzyme
MKREIFWKNKGYKVGKPVKGLHKTKYLIVGGGVTGLTLAHFLIEEGTKPSDIALVEAEFVGSGSTGHSAGILIPEIETEKNVGWEAFIERYGLKLARAYRRSFLDALATIEGIIKKGKIACDARKGDFLILARDAEAKERVEDDMRARRMMGERPAALHGVYLFHEFGSPGFVFAERDVKALSVNPLAMVQGIATYLRKQGVCIFENSRLESVYRNTARFKNGAIDFEKIIYARGTGEKYPRLHKYVSTISVTQKLSATQLDELRLADLDLFIDEEGIHSYHYGKITGDGRLLLGYGDVRTTQMVSDSDLHEPHLRNIRRFLAAMFPTSKLEIHYAWSGAYAISQDLLPVVDFVGDAVILNGAGIQLGSVAAAHYTAHMLVNGKHPLARLWHPKEV